MNRALSFLLAALALLAACDSVVVDKPFGETPSKVEREEWDGNWNVDDETVVRVRVVDAASGLLEAASIKLVDDALKTERTSIHLRKSGGWNFLFLKPESADEGYTWFKYENLEGKMLLLWLPSAAKFKAAVEQGLMSGEVTSKTFSETAGSPFGSTKQTTVFLKDIRKQDIDLIMSEDRGVFFDWQHPLPILRVGE